MIDIFSCSDHDHSVKNVELGNCGTKLIILPVRYGEEVQEVHFAQFND